MYKVKRGMFGGWDGDELLSVAIVDTRYPRNDRNNYYVDWFTDEEWAKHGDTFQHIIKMGNRS